MTQAEELIVKWDAASTANERKEVLTSNTIRYFIKLLDAPMHHIMVFKDGSCITMDYKTHHDWKQVCTLAPHKVLVDTTQDWSDGIPTETV